MKIKHVSCLSLVSLLTSFSVMASDLTIVNNTNRDSTSVINNGPCSDILGASGITHAHSTNVVPENMIYKGCISNRTNCRADVHMTSNCTGPTVAVVIFDVKRGIKSVQPVDTSQGYTISGNGFTATMDGGPSFKHWLRHFFG